MPQRTVSEDLKACIPALHHDGYSIKDICGLLAVKKTLVYRTLAQHRRAGKRPRIAREVVTAPASERREELRARYMNRIGAEARDANMLLFLDGFAFPKHGRSGKGRRQRAVRGTRYSILPTLTLDGVIAYDIVEGPVSCDRFVQFLKDCVMAFTSPYPGPRSVLVIGDCGGGRHGEKVRELVEDMHLCKLIYLPPRSPGYNPIEDAMSTVESCLRHNDRDGPMMAIVRACQSITPDQAAGYFRATGYIA